METVPISQKYTLTIKEAAEYSNIGINKLNELTNDTRCNFVLRVGKKKLIKRNAFESFLTNALEI